MPHRLVSQYEKRGSSSGSAGSSKKKRKKKVVKEEASEVPPESTFLPGEIMPLDAEESEKDMAVVEEEEPEVVNFSGESHSGKKYVLMLLLLIITCVLRSVTSFLSWTQCHRQNNRTNRGIVSLFP